MPGVPRYLAEREFATETSGRARRWPLLSVGEIKRGLRLQREDLTCAGSESFKRCRDWLSLNNDGQTHQNEDKCFQAFSEQEAIASGSARVHNHEARKRCRSAEEPKVSTSVIFWRRTDVEGLERLELSEEPDRIVSNSTVVCFGGRGFRLDHRWWLDPDWRVQSVTVEV
jgi:hypothetical protein